MKALRTRAETTTTELILRELSFDSQRSIYSAVLMVRLHGRDKGGLKAKMMRFAVIRPLYRQVRYRLQDARNFPTRMVNWKYNSALQFQLFFGTNSNSVLERRAYNMAGRVLAMARAKAAILAAVCISIAAGRGATHYGWRRPCRSRCAVRL